MRIALILLAVLAAATIGAAIWFRTVSMPAETWHVDPAAVTPPATPNFDLRVGERAPVFDATPDVMAARLDAIAAVEGAALIGGSLAEGHMTYIVRSRLMGYPDAVSIRLVPVGQGTRVEIFSRSRFGHSDIGVNAARVERWISTARAQTGP
ncbi:DUF1499 domain-containing protein [Roseicyclus persicicus]|uniref:DUF1499 domain-containing protein n=1 Tax=Roseicyclus persicicus TaxID=2650661 RepID=A0A7X6GYR3_9RHOB|nr:DUF1499 domain-containing protein [Roseibacterium persicicum]NKX44852.1 DUF1499 domain-containing protein [Roseibacterium persicicum]